ncbi:MAG: AAA family ATPase [Cyanobacteria bacterium P01_A01_bin.116]
MLYIFSGLPGTGKSTLAAALAQRRNAVHLRVDTIEQAIKSSTGLEVGPEGYDVAYAVAAENLGLGLDVVADSVNSLEITRKAWQNVATTAQCAFVDIEIICSDSAEHRRRVESRTTTVQGLKLPSWEQVLARDYLKWTENHIVIDTAGETVEQSIHKMCTVLGVSVLFEL